MHVIIWSGKVGLGGGLALLLGFFLVWVVLRKVMYDQAQKFQVYLVIL